MMKAAVAGEEKKAYELEIKSKSVHLRVLISGHVTFNQSDALKSVL